MWKLDAVAISTLARLWLAELESPFSQKYSETDWARVMGLSLPLDEKTKTWLSFAPDIGRWVVLMNFRAPPEKQWCFIETAVDLAESDAQLTHIAAGPVEHLLGWHGEQFIARIEEKSAADRKFARMMTAVWKYKMPDSVWGRVRVIQFNVEDPLPEMQKEQ